MGEQQEVLEVVHELRRMGLEQKMREEQLREVMLRLSSNVADLLAELRTTVKAIERVIESPRTEVAPAPASDQFATIRLLSIALIVSALGQAGIEVLMRALGLKP